MSIDARVALYASGKQDLAAYKKLLGGNNSNYVRIKWVRASFQKTLRRILYKHWRFIKTYKMISRLKKIKNNK